MFYISSKCNSRYSSFRTDKCGPHTSFITLEGVFPQAVPSRKTWRRPLMVRQPYSVAVPSTGGRLHPLVPEGREAW